MASAARRGRLGRGQSGKTQDPLTNGIEYTRQAAARLFGRGRAIAPETCPHRFHDRKTKRPLHPAAIDLYRVLGREVPWIWRW